MNGVYALYPDPHAAQRAVDRLRAEGIARREITVIASEPFEECEFSDHDKATWLYWIAGAGGFGGLCLGSWLTSMTEKAWPLPTGGMPIVAFWPNLVVIFELTMLSAILSTVVALLITARLPHLRATLYDADVSRGYILVGVERATSVDAVQRALQSSDVARMEIVASERLG